MSRITSTTIAPIHSGPVPIMVYVSQKLLPRHFVERDLDVTWLRSAQYRVVLEHFDVHVSALVTYCDVSGLLHTLGRSIEAAAAAAGRFKVTPDTTLRTRLLVDVHDNPVLPFEELQSSGEVRHWRSLDISDDLYYRNEDLGKAWLAGDQQYRFDNPLPRIQQRAVLEDYEVWSSHSSANDRAVQIARLRELVAAPFRLG